MFNVSSILGSFDNLTLKPEEFLSCQKNLTDQLKTFLKTVYDATSSLDEGRRSAVLELIVDDFNEEQIWQELEVRNQEDFDECLSSVIEMLVEKNSLLFPLAESNGMEEVLPSNGNHEEKLSVVECTNDDYDNEIPSDTTSERGSSVDRDIGNNDDTLANKIPDRFFNYSEMQQFLDNEDKNAMSNTNTDKEGDDGDDYNLYFGSDGGFKENEDVNPKYFDFFDPPDSGTKVGSIEMSQTSSDFNSKYKVKDVGLSVSNKRRKFDNDESDGDTTIDSRNVPEMLLSKVHELEERALGEKPWQLKGEITSGSRPYNALLEEVIEFDASQRPAPIITNETSFKLEDVIKKRINDSAYDDVEKKIKPVQTPHEFKKRVTLDQQKSKISLAEIYEQEYLKQVDAKDSTTIKSESDQESHIEIKKMMQSLFSVLDSLSNFCYTPKPVVPEVKIVSNLPAAVVEDVAPVLSTDVNLLAPEEISDKKSNGFVIGKDERSSTDRKRHRRKKKQFQGKLYNELGKRNMYKTNITINLKNALQPKTAAKQENVSSFIKSSKQFFGKLQDEVSSGGKTKPAGKQTGQYNARKLKL